MPEFISKTELELQSKDNKKTHYAGEIYQSIFSHDKGLEFKEGMQLEAGIIWFGGYLLDSTIFPKQRCPACGKENVLIPYKAIGSLLSGSHTIQFHCTNCKERFVTNNYTEYFRKIKKYVIENRQNFKTEQKLNNCTDIITKLPSNK